MSRSRSIQNLLVFVSMALTTALVHAQPGGGRGGGGSGDFRQRMMERMDSNGNGKLEENEVSDRARGFIEGMVRNAGGTVRYPLSISEVIGGGRSGRGGDRSRGRGDRKDRDRDKKKADTNEERYPLLARFGDDSVRGFGLDPHLLNGRIVDVDKVFSESVLGRVKSAMDRYDEDESGVLEYAEWKGVRWSTDPRDADLDHDGRLTRAEMAERYRSRESGSSSSRERFGSSRDRDRGRGDTDRGRGGDRGDSGRGRGSASGFSGRGGRGGPGGFDPSAMLKRFDRDGDGKINFDQMDDRVKSFASRMLERVGMEAKGNISIDEIRKKMEAARGGSGNSDRSRRSTTAAKKKETPKSKLIEGADQYGGRYSFRREEAELEGVPKWWNDRDRNGDGQVTISEYFTSRSGSRATQLKDFGKLDANDDGIITPTEAESVDD